MADLITTFGLAGDALSNLTSAVQFGFIAGTLVFAVLTITDRFSPSKVFLVSALLGALFNGMILWEGNGPVSLLALRALTGFFLAGIYPVGMKIAADYFDKGLGTSLGFLVGALVLGTAFPHLLGAVGEKLPWRTVLLITSGLAVFGGMLIGFFVPDGPYRLAGASIRPGAFFKVFREADFRAAAFGYFGHMWELYAFWAYVPVLLTTYSVSQGVELNVPAWSFAVIAVGGPACVAGGFLARRLGERRVAAGALTVSGICCLLLPLTLTLPLTGFLIFLMSWGAVVVADSPLFSTLVAQSAPAESKGTALTIVNCIGFAVTIVSIQFVGWLINTTGSVTILMLLAVGPILGLVAMQLRRK